MKKYAIYCRDKVGSADLRKSGTGPHLKHVEDHLSRYHVAGPIRNAQGNTVGSLLIVDAEDAVDARKFLEMDPYHALGFWETIHIEEFMPAAGAWIGGKIW